MGEPIYYQETLDLTDVEPAEPLSGHDEENRS